MSGRAVPRMAVRKTLFLIIHPKLGLGLLSLLWVCFGQAQIQPPDQPDPFDADPITFRATVQGGLVSNFSGGIQSGIDYIGKVHLTLSLDTELAGLWTGGEWFINGVNTHGGNPTARLIGDFQPISRNEAAPERTGLFELWYKHTIGKAFILVGQHDMNTAFATSRYAGNSIHSAFGMSPSITPNAAYSFSIFPRTMPAVYAGYEGLKLGSGELAIHAAVYAGASEDIEDDRYNLVWNIDGSTHSRFELHYKQRRGVIKLGAMYHSGDFPSVLQEGEKVKGNMGLYIITDQLILPQGADGDQGLGVFFQLGTAPGEHNLIRTFVSTGLNYTGLLRNRADDVLFFGFLNSTMHKDLVEDQGYEASRSVLEMSYSLRLGQHFVLQPDLQYILNPGADPTLKNAFLGIFRFSINY